MKRASDLAEDIAGLIDNNVWREGQRLPAERALCEQFGSARNTVRKALEQLEKQARIARHGGRGFVVSCEPVQLPQNDFLANISRASPADILELRLIVEPMAAALAAARASLPEIEGIEHSVLAIEAATSLSEREEADAQFHLALFSATRNPLLLSLCNTINGVREQAQWYERKRQILTEERRGVYDRQHREITAALRRRDGNAASAAMRLHLETLRQDLLGLPALS